MPSGGPGVKRALPARRVEAIGPIQVLMYSPFPMLHYVGLSVQFIAPVKYMLSYRVFRSVILSPIWRSDYIYSIQYNLLEQVFLCIAARLL